MIGKVVCRTLTADEIATYCDAWREFCQFMENYEEEEPILDRPFYPSMLRKFRELRDKYGPASFWSRKDGK